MTAAVCDTCSGVSLCSGGVMMACGELLLRLKRVGRHLDAERHLDSLNPATDV